MSEINMRSCDACGEVAPDSHSPLLPTRGWFVVKSRHDDGFFELDACSTTCLEKVTRELVASTT
jgi:hypothetical protein